jgi:hypothetical protein
VIRFATGPQFAAVNPTRRIARGEGILGSFLNHIFDGLADAAARFLGRVNDRFGIVFFFRHVRHF